MPAKGENYEGLPSEGGDPSGQAEIVAERIRRLEAAIEAAEALRLAEEAERARMENEGGHE